MDITRVESDFIHQSNKIFYKGIIEDNNDPLQMARYRIRILGIHANDTVNVPTNTLPWAMSMNPLMYGFNQGTGMSSIAQIGTWVWCIFDNGDVNIPVIVGAIVGGNDINNRARGDAYTKVHTIQTKNNHIIEIDDSTDNIRLLHSNGSELLITPDTFVINAVGNTSILTKGNTNISTTGTTDITSTGNITANTSGNLSSTIGGNLNVTATGTGNITSAGPMKVQGSSLTLQGSSVMVL